MLLGLICPREIFTNSGKIGEADDLLTVWLTADGKKPISRTSKLTKKFSFIFGASNAFWLTLSPAKDNHRTFEGRYEIYIIYKNLI